MGRTRFGPGISRLRLRVITETETTKTYHSLTDEDKKYSVNEQVEEMTRRILKNKYRNKFNRAFFEINATNQEVHRIINKTSFNGINKN